MKPIETICSQHILFPVLCDTVLLARFALTLQNKPKFHGDRRRHLWKLWRSNNLTTSPLWMTWDTCYCNLLHHDNHDNHDSEMPYLLGLMSFSQRPLSQLLDFWPQGYQEVSPSECMCMWSEATLKSKQNMFLACFGSIKLFFPSPLWPDFARQARFVPANTDQNLSNDTWLPLKSTQKLVDKMLLAWEKDQHFSMTSNLLKTVFLRLASRTVVGLLAPGLSGDEAFQINSNQNAVHNLYKYRKYPETMQQIKGHTSLETYRNDLFTAHFLSSPL